MGTMRVTGQGVSSLQPPRRGVSKGFWRTIPPGWNLSAQEHCVLDRLLRTLGYSTDGSTSGCETKHDSGETKKVLSRASLRA